MENDTKKSGGTQSETMNPVSNTPNLGQIHLNNHECDSETHTKELKTTNSQSIDQNVEHHLPSQETLPSVKHKQSVEEHQMPHNTSNIITETHSKLLKTSPIQFTTSAVANTYTLFTLKYNTLTHVFSFLTVRDLLTLRLTTRPCHEYAMRYVNEQRMPALIAEVEACECNKINENKSKEEEEMKEGVRSIAEETELISGQRELDKFKRLWLHWSGYNAPGYKIRVRDLIIYLQDHSKLPKKYQPLVARCLVASILSIYLRIPVILPQNSEKEVNKTNNIPHYTTPTKTFLDDEIALFLEENFNEISTCIFERPWHILPLNADVIKHIEELFQQIRSIFLARGSMEKSQEVNEEEPEKVERENEERVCEGITEYLQAICKLQKSQVVLLQLNILGRQRDILTLKRVNVALQSLSASEVQHEFGSTYNDQRILVLRLQSKNLSTEELAFMAEVSERMDRYDSKFEYVKTIIDVTGGDLSPDHRRFLVSAYLSLLRSWKDRLKSRVYLREKARTKPEKGGQVHFLDDQINEQQTKINTHIHETLNLFHNTLLRHHNTTADHNIPPEVIVSYMKMKGDCYRHHLERLPDEEDAVNAKVYCKRAYEIGLQLGSRELKCTDPALLGLILCYTVGLYELLNEEDKAIELTQEWFTKGLKEIETLNEEDYKNAASILQMMRDNLALWKCNVDSDADN